MVADAVRRHRVGALVVDPVLVATRQVYYVESINKHSVNLLLHCFTASLFPSTFVSVPKAPWLINIKQTGAEL